MIGYIVNMRILYTYGTIRFAVDYTYGTITTAQFYTYGRIRLGMDRRRVDPSS